MICTQSRNDTHPTDACGPLVGALASVLSELRAVVASLPQGAYAARAGKVFADASIGGHVRHCLDHVRALADGCRKGLIDYDRRARGTPIESDPALALAEADSLIALIEGLSASLAADPVRVSILPSRAGECTLVSSTLARELAFVLSHTVHHNSTIRAMAVAAGAGVPGSFGFAPSTLAHKDRCECAR